MPDNDKNENEQADSSSEAAAKSDTHPMCENAPDKEKCEEFVERLDEASNNIDPKQD